MRDELIWSYTKGRTYKCVIKDFKKLHLWVDLYLVKDCGQNS